MISVTANTDMQNVPVMNELLDYYNNVARFFGLTQIEYLGVDDDDKVYDIVRSLQDAVTDSSYYGRAVNPSATFTGHASSSGYPDDYATRGISQLYSDAGIASGLRRVAGTTAPSDWTDYNDAAYSYGVVQDGDMIGPWLFVDLQILINFLRAFKITAIRKVSKNGVNHAMTINYEEFHWGVYDPDDYSDYPPDSEIDYVSRSTTSFLSGNGSYEEDATSYSGTTQDIKHTWTAYHERFSLCTYLYATSSQLGSKVIAKYYGRITAGSGGATFWSYPFGSEHTTTAELASVTVDSVYPQTDLFGGNAFTTCSDLYLVPRPDWPADIGPYAAYMSDVVCRLEMNWAAL